MIINGNNKKRLALFSVLILLALCFTGCSAKKVQDNNEDTQETENTVGLVYLPSYTELECELDTAKFYIATRAFYYMFVNDNAVYGIAGAYNEATHVREQYLIANNISTGEYTQEYLGAWSEFYQTGQGFAAYRNKTLYIYDDSFTYKKEISLSGVGSKLEEEGKKLSVDGVEEDAQGNICIISGDCLVYMDGDGNVLRVMETPAGAASVEQVLVTPSGDWYIMCFNNDMKVDIYNVDMGTGLIGEKLANVPDIYQYNMRRMGVMSDTDLYMITQDYIYSYNPAMGEYRELICLRDYGLDSPGVSGMAAFGMSEKGEFYIAVVTDTGVDDYNYDSDDGGTATVVTELAVVTGKTEAEVSQRKELVMAAFIVPTYSYRDPIMKFNKYNTEYYVTVKSYFNYDFDEYDTALTNFYNDLITGKGADLFWFMIDDGIDIDNLAQKGVLEDMYGLLDSDEKISRDEFIPSVLSAMETDGSLYAISPDFKLVTMVGKSSLIDQYEEWNFTTMYELINSHEGARLFDRMSRQHGLDYFLRYSMDLFYDRNTGECSFNSDDFINMLKVVEILPEKNTILEDAEIKRMIAEDELLLCDEQALDGYAIRMVDAYFDNADKTYAGYPSKSHSPATIVIENSMAVSRLSDNKDAAWDFIKYYLDVFEWYRFSVFSEKFEATLEELMNAEESGKSGNPLNTPLTEAQAQTLIDLAESSTGHKQYDMAIYNIVYEEAQGFLSGQRSAEEAAAII